MNLNELRPSPNSKRPKKRLGRGIGSTLGKTSGKGHKGQKARAGGFHKIGFEGGQMPLQRRLPKLGFTKPKRFLCAEIKLSDLAKLKSDIVNIDTLKESGIISVKTRQVKIIDSGAISRKYSVHGLSVTNGANKKILDLGGIVEV